MARLNRPLPSPYLDPLIAHQRHLLATDPERFLVAVRPATDGATFGATDGHDQVVAFGIAAQREHVWFLSQLYVLPHEQGRGIGRALLTQIMPSLPAESAANSTDQRHGILAMCTDSAQPASNGLYARFGIVPRAPVFNLVGTPNPADLSRLPAGVAAFPFGPPGSSGSTDSAAIQAIDAIDRQVLGYAHQADHTFLRTSGRTGFVYRTDDNEPVGYGYSSEAGRFGPVALLDDTLTAPVLGHLMTVIRPRGATSAWVPGANDRAMVALLRAGLRIEGFPALLCWSRPFARFESYLPASLALL